MEKKTFTKKMQNKTKRPLIDKVGTTPKGTN